MQIHVINGILQNIHQSGQSIKMFSGGGGGEENVFELHSIITQQTYGALVFEQEFRRLQEVFQIARTAEVYWAWICGITSDPPFFNCSYSNYFHNVIRLLNSAEIRVKVG